MFKIADGIRFLKEYPNLTRSNDTSLQVNSTYGYIRIGAANASYGHIMTDRSQFYFNKKLTDGMYIVTIKLENGESLSSKILIKN